ncbi:metallophosphoesterase [bacterium SCSIO 12741]|nr:metallophosphoesterase [bacterium SCSIO 12741]
MLILILLFLLLLEFYVFQAIQSAWSSDFSLAWEMAYWATSLFTAIAVISYNRIYRLSSVEKSQGMSIFFGLAMSLIFTKVLFSFLMLGEDLFRMAMFAGESIYDGEMASWKDRNLMYNEAGLLLTSLPLLYLGFGIFKGKYRYRVHRVTLTFDHLPDAFDGFTLAQISDVHSGSFDSRKGVQKGLDLLQEQNPDLILFTGDLVNNLADEVKPYIDLFAKLKAPFGKFSVLGNHDYGEYVSWPSKEDWLNNMDRLARYEKEMGFDLLNNRHVRLEKDGESIVLAGVENWGKPPFPQRGDLQEALRGSKSDDFSILLSHDPSHWDLQVLDFPKKVDLTLSGHTHGMQFGIEIPGFKWSPVKYKYPRWAGLYEEKDRYLYVNRGFGFLGFPGRSGIWPEITLITLKKEAKA